MPTRKTGKKTIKSRPLSTPRNMNPLLRASIHSRKRGVRQNNARAPIGMPMRGTYLREHRLGSRVRSPRSRFLQEGRRFSRRNPELAAMRLASSRPFESDTNNLAELRKHEDFYIAQNIAHAPHSATYSVSDRLANDSLPLQSAERLSPKLVARAPRNESGLWQNWRTAIAREIAPLPKR